MDKEVDKESNDNFADFEIYKSINQNDEWLNMGIAKFNNFMSEVNPNKIESKPEETRKRVEGDMVSSTMNSVETKSNENNKDIENNKNNEINENDKNDKDNKDNEVNPIETEINTHVGKDEKVLQHKLTNMTTKVTTKEMDKQPPTKVIPSTSSVSTTSTLKIPKPKIPMNQMNILEKLEYSKDLGN